MLCHWPCCCSKIYPESRKNVLSIAKHCTTKHHRVFLLYPFVSSDLSYGSCDVMSESCSGLLRKPGAALFRVLSKRPAIRYYYY